MLRFHFEWDEKIPRGDIEAATRGKLHLSLGDNVVWNNIEWAWYDLLSFLCTNWSKLQNEGILSDSASESEKYDFSISHDLAYVPRGRSPLPSIIFARKGLQMQITTGETVTVISTPDAMRNLRQLGNAVARRLLPLLLKDERASTLLNKWIGVAGPLDLPQPDRLKKRDGPRPPGPQPREGPCRRK
jgi:hypothetical protein